MHLESFCCTLEADEETISLRGNEGMSEMRILIADRRPRIRFALCVLLKRQKGLDLVGEAADARDFEAQIESARPDAVLLDWRLDGSATADLLAALRERYPRLYIAVLSGRPEEQHAALAAGADVFVSKIDPPNKLLAAIRCVQQLRAAAPSLEQVSRDQMLLDGGGGRC
jgi:DNA-binding NarL/FixJ family response regulator